MMIDDRQPLNWLSNALHTMTIMMHSSTRIPSEGRTFRGGSTVLAVNITWWWFTTCPAVCLCTVARLRL